MSKAMQFPRAVAEPLETRTMMAVSTPLLLTADVTSSAHVAAVGNTLFFTKSTPEYGNELWKTDGTVAGTMLVKDIMPGTFSAGILGMKGIGGAVYFSANDTGGGRALYRSDGTPGGSVPIARLDSSIGNITDGGNGVIYFTGATAAHGQELYRTSGSGFLRLSDISAGSSGSSVGGLFNFNGTIYFYAYDRELNQGVELYKSDGTAAGTVLVKDINPGEGNSAPLWYGAAGGRLYFNAFTDAHGNELWTTDGTAAGTRLVRDINPGTAGSGAHPEETIGNTLYFTTRMTSAPPQLWKLDGPTAQPTFIKNIGHANGGETFYLHQLNGKLIFEGHDAARGSELWTSDGTAAGTNFFKEINPGTGSSIDDTLDAKPLVHQEYLFFKATDATSGKELWATDGHGSTFRVADLEPGAAGSDPDHFAAAATSGKLFFHTIDRSSPSLFRKLWVVDVTPPSPPSATGSIGGTLFNDADADREKDTGETGLAGWKVFIDADRDGVLDTGEKTATTDASGNYRFTGLAAGTYRVREVLNAGWRRTTPSSGYHDVTLLGGATSSGRNFGNTQKVAISGTLWNDTDGDGVKDSGEAALPSWRAFLDTDKDGVWDSTERGALTGAGGGYLFENLAAGSYRVRVVQPFGWRRTTPGSGYYDVTLQNGWTSTNRNFGFTQRVLISGSVFNDANGDRIRNSGELGLASWRVFLDADSDGVWDSTERSTLTDASGNYSFKDLLAGTYRVRVVQQSGWTRTTPTAGYHSITLTSGQTSTGRLFGERRI